MIMTIIYIKLSSCMKCCVIKQTEMLLLRAMPPRPFYFHEQKLHYYLVPAQEPLVKAVGLNQLGSLAELMEVMTSLAELMEVMTSLAEALVVGGAALLVGGIEILVEGGAALLVGGIEILVVGP
uniref:Uncharacterized protein n=1 Tax=Salix viminalis TaxID=40686 RepID=A0A6N2MTK8_SALVM